MDTILDEYSIEGRNLLDIDITERKKLVINLYSILKLMMVKNLLDLN